MKIISLTIVALQFICYFRLLSQCQYTTLTGKLEELEKISFADSLNGMIGTWEGVVLKTSDGGYTWIEQDIRYGTLLRIHAVSMLDSSAAYAVTSEGEIFKTINGGADWISKGFPTGSFLYGVSFIDADHGVVAGGGGKIGLTSDGGSTWQVGSFGGGLVFYNVAYVEKNNIFAVGSQGVIVRSTDGGANWSLRMGNAYDVFRSLSFRGSTGYVVGYRYITIPMILKTTDGGDVWNEQTVLFNNGLSDVSFLDSLRGIACGEGMILSTINGGITWQDHPMYGFKSIQHIRYLPTGEIIAVGDHISTKNSIIKIGKVGCTRPFVQVFPVDNAENISLLRNLPDMKSVRFSWRFYSIVKLSSAHIQISYSPDFSEIWTDSIIVSVTDESDTTVIVSNFLPETGYYWRLTLNNLDGTPTEWSDVRRFTTAGGVINGFVFEDVNRDGNRDDDERGIPNWPLGLSGTGVITLRTDENGYYEVVGLDSGNYVIRDFYSPLWRRVQPDSGFYKITLKNKDTVSDCNFSYYFPWNTINGFVFNDKNEDGTKDETDPGLSQWCVRFSGPVGKDSVFTDADGSYSFRKVSAGMCTIRVCPPEGWEQIYPRLGREHSYYFYDYDQQFTANFSFHPIPPRIKIPIYFHDNRSAPVVKLQLGVRQGATNGIWGVDPSCSLIDYSEGELEIPPQLPGTLDARFVSPPNTPYDFGLGSWTDMRSYISPAQVDTYVIRFSAGIFEGGEYPVTFRWSAAAVGDAYLYPVWFSIASEFTIDMKNQDSIVISNPDLITARIIAAGPVISPDDVSENNVAIPSRYTLEQNYPNPFNPRTAIRYNLPFESRVKLEVYTILGECIVTLIDRIESPGYQSVEFNPTTLSSGIYFYCLTAEPIDQPAKSFKAVRKMLLLR